MFPNPFFHIPLVQSVGTLTTVIFYDSFTDTPGKTLITHTPDIGPAWANPWGGQQWLISASGTTTTSTGTFSIPANFVNVGVSDFTLTALGVTLGSGNIAFRFNPLGSRAASIGYYIDGNGGTQVRLIERNTGVITTRGTATPSTPPWDIIVTVSGSNIVVNVDGVDEITYSSAIYDTQTQIGVWDINPGSVIDSLEVVA